MDLSLEGLGFTKEDLQERVIDRICETLLSSMEYDPDGDGEYPVASKFQQAIKQRIVQEAKDTINAIAEKHVLPNVAQYIEELTIQKTSEYGEKRGESFTFIEYLTARAKEYMQEKVNYDGEDKAECGRYSFSGVQTRITHLVNKHLHNSIETAMKDAMSLATGEIARGIHETARLKLNEIAASLKVQVSTK